MATDADRTHDSELKIVVTGDPVSGITVYGPFETFDDALAYAERYDGDWWIADLNPICEAAPGR